MSKIVKVKVGSVKQAGKDFISAWEHVEAGHTCVSENELHFETATLLLKTLTPKRLELLRAVKNEKNISIRALSKILKRDYKNTFQDTKMLNNVGLIDIDEETSLVNMPWERIIIEIPMDANDDKFNTSKKNAS